LCLSAKVAIAVTAALHVLSVPHVPVEIVRRVIVQQEIVVHVRRGPIVPVEIVRRVIVQSEIVVRVRHGLIARRETDHHRETARQEIVPHALPGQWEIDLRVHHAQRDQPRSPKRRVLKCSMRLQRLHHHRRQLRLRPVFLRASRGDSKPCYWHRHVISTANSIAVV
jgi:hypothetical protein